MDWLGWLDEFKFEFGAIASRTIEAIALLALLGWSEILEYGLALGLCEEAAAEEEEEAEVEKVEEESTLLLVLVEVLVARLVEVFVEVLVEVDGWFKAWLVVTWLVTWLALFSLLLFKLCCWAAWSTSLLEVIWDCCSPSFISFVVVIKESIYRRDWMEEWTRRENERERERETRERKKR